MKFTQVIVGVIILLALVIPLTDTESKPEEQPSPITELKLNKGDKDGNFNGLFADSHNSIDIVVAQTPVQIPSLVKENPPKTIEYLRRNSGYPYGWCTYWASQQRPDIPGGFGNAKNWLKAAEEAGFQIGTTPDKDSVLVTSESSLGHVAIVEDVTPETIVISEMNYVRWGIISRRVIPRDYRAIKGYIY
jgi:surface antigen